MQEHFRPASTAGALTQRNASNIIPSSLTTLLPLVKFCAVGGTGLLVDTVVLGILADPKFLGINVTLSKICAAEIAMINNFIWNELWTFKTTSERTIVKKYGVLHRFAMFNAICGIGIGFAVALLHVFHTWLGWNLYLSNLLAIVLVTCWNFGINARFNWRTVKASR